MKKTISASALSQLEGNAEIMRSYHTISVYSIMQSTQILHSQFTVLLHFSASLLTQFFSSKQMYRNSQRSPFSRYDYDKETQVVLQKNTTRDDNIDAVDNCADQQQRAQ